MLLLSSFDCAHASIGPVPYRDEDETGYSGPISLELVVLACWSRCNPPAPYCRG